MRVRVNTGKVAKGVAVFALVAFGAVMCSSDGSEESASNTAAWMACKDAVEARLANPATADFSLMSVSMSDTVIDGLLTAKNAFGVEQELQFHCGLVGERVTSVEVLPSR